MAKHYNQVAVEKPGGFVMMSVEQFEAIPLNERVKLVLAAKVQFLMDGAVVPTAVALGKLPASAPDSSPPPSAGPPPATTTPSSPSIPVGTALVGEARHVLRLERSQVATMIFSPGAGGVEIVVNKAVAAGPEQWNISAPRQATTNSRKVTALFWTLSGLRATTVFDDSPADWQVYGINAASPSVAFLDSQAVTLAQLHIGAPVPGRPSSVFARGSDNRALEVDTARLADMPRDVEDLVA